jgi:hypothetical protein
MQNRERRDQLTALDIELPPTCSGLLGTKLPETRSCQQLYQEGSWPKPDPSALKEDSMQDATGTETGAAHMRSLLKFPIVPGLCNH